MKIPASPNRIVSLDNVQENNIVYIDLSCKQEESIFEQQYRKAARIIGEIIDRSASALESRNTYCRNCKSRACNSCKHRDRSSCREDNGLPRNLTAFQTAIPFIGDRGTGKSSIMCSLLERLRNYDGNNRDAVFDLGVKYDNIRFITFDMIDANMLRNTDDVMEIILSRMLTYLEEFRMGDEFRELYRQIDELHEDLCLVHGDRRGKREEYGLASLQRVADSQKAIENFQKLVREFIQVMSVQKFGCNRCFMVVALDDIDMYQGSESGMGDSQFALLEHIYSHMRIPGLIVLLTYNEHLLKRTCNRHFEDIYFGNRKPTVLSLTEQRDINGLTAQFMSKMFPMQNRIYMPDYMLVDSADRPNLFVKPVFDAEIVPPFTDKKEVMVKEFMLRMIAHKTGVYFDAAGTKKHFFEPRNLRDLGELFSFVYHMEEIEESASQDQQEKLRGQNRQELLSYLYNQFALRHLTEEEYDTFQSLSMLPLYRQNRTLVDMIRQHRMKMTSNEDDFGYLSKTREDRWRYSYGELMNNIYFSTRISKDSSSTEPFFRKEFMHCIFGTHSVQLNETVRNADSRKSMLSVIGSSVAGRWANKMLPKFWDVDTDKVVGAGSISLPVRDYFDWEIPEDVQKALWMLDTDDNSAQEQVRLFLEALVLAGMFFTNFPAHRLGIRVDAKHNRQMKPSLHLRSDSNEHVCFNVLNFVINLYGALPDDDNSSEGYLNYIQGKLQMLGRNLVEKMMTNWAEERSLIDSELKDWEDKRDNMLYDPMVGARIRSRIEELNREKEHVNAWYDLTSEQVFPWEGHQEKYLQNWDQLLRGIIRDFGKSIRSWQSNHKDCQLVLPVQNFDMMYNILKRLANVSYHDIPDTAPVEEVYDYYVHLYRSMEEELRSQDRVYFGNEDGFSKAFRDSLFYRIVTAEEGGRRHNPYLEQVLVSMVRTTTRHQDSRKRSYDISIY